MSSVTVTEGAWKIAEDACTRCNPPTFDCDLCGKSFPVSWGLQVHQMAYEAAGKRLCK